MKYSLKNSYADTLERNTNGLETVQYNLADNEQYIIEEYQEDPEEAAIEPPEYETMFIESVESPDGEHSCTEMELLSLKVCCRSVHSL